MQQAEAKAAHAGQKVALPQHADVLEGPFPRPAVDGDLEDGFLDVDESHLPQPGGVLVAQEEHAVGRLGRAPDIQDPSQEGAVLRYAPVVASRQGMDLLGFKPPTRLQVVKGPLDDLEFRIGPAAEGDSRVYVVEVVGIIPVLGPAWLSADQHSLRQGPATSDW